MDLSVAASNQMSLNYKLTQANNQITIEILSMNFGDEQYISDDNFLLITKVAGGTCGNYGYGGLCIFCDPAYLPITLATPQYEYEQDLIDVTERTKANIKRFNGNVLP